MRSGITSSLSLDELYYSILMRLIEEEFENHPSQVRREDRSIIGNYTDRISEIQEVILSFENFEIVAADRNIIGKIPILLQKYQLLPRDCIHLQTMLNHSENELLTTDGDFNNIPMINSLLQEHLEL